jgi:cytoskeleton protein RodZ
MDSIGERLRQERLRRGWDISQIAEATKINPAMLEAIEADDLDRLPGKFFTRAFIRQYARALGFDEDEFEPELQQMAVRDQPPIETSPSRMEYSVAPVRPSRSGTSPWVGAGAAFFLILAACSGIYWLWERTHQPVAETPRARPALHEPAPQTPPPAGTAAPVTPPPAASTNTPPAETPATPAQPPAPGAPAAQPPAETAAPPEITKSSVPADEQPAVRLEIRATQDVWVRVVGDRTLLYEGTLKAGQLLRSDGSAYLRTRLGRPDGVDLTWNGQKVKEALNPGQPVTIEFTAQRIRVVPPAPPEPDAP